MATILNNAAYMALPMNIKRGNPIPLDTTAVWYNKTELENYAKNGATAYVGQVLTLVAGGKCEAYMISNEAGTLVKLAQTTASGDLASDVANLQTQVEGLVEKVGSAAAGDTAASGLYKLIADVEAAANDKVSSVSAADTSVTIGGAVTAPTVKVAISAAEGNSLSVGEDGLFVSVPEVIHPEYSLAAAETSEGMLKSYKLQKDGKDIAGSVLIDIPKDLVVSSGSVVELENGALPDGVTEAGTYIKLILANNEKPLYINVGKLIEYVTGGSGENDAIQINVSSDTHKVTANVKNGSLTKEMLAAGVVASLGKADSAVQTVVAGEANGTIKVDGKEVAVAGLKDAAFATVESINATAQGYVNTAKQALEGTEKDNDESATIKGAKKYADKVAKAASDNAGAALSNKIAELKNTDEAVANQFVTAVKEENGVVTVERKALVADDIPELGQSKISGLTDALNAKQDTVAFDGEYSAQNKAATVSTVNSAAAAVVGTDKDIDTSDTVKGAKKYADSKASAAINEAKAYVDGLIAGDSGITKRVETLEGKVDVDKVSTAIATAKSGAEDTAAADAAAKVKAAKTAILGESATGVDFDKTVKEVYDLASSKTTMAEVEAKGYAIKADTDSAIADAKKAGTDAATAAAAAKQAADAAQAAADAKVASVKAADKSVTIGGTDTEPTVKVAISATAGNALALDTDGLKVTIPAAAEYSIVKDANAVDGYAATYRLTKGGENVGAAINIPKDMVVKTGSVEINPEGKAAGTYLVLVLANATEDKVYIPVDSLIEYVTSGSSAEDMVVVSVDEITHKVTATITNGTITEEKLHADVQTALNKANSAIQTADLAPYAKSADVENTYVKKNGTDRLFTAAEATKLAGIAEGAQVNVIESIKLNGTALSIDTKAVNIPLVTADTAGIVISSADENTISYANGIGTVNSLNVNKLAQTEGDVLIIDGGKA